MHPFDTLNIKWLISAALIQYLFYSFIYSSKAALSAPYKENFRGFFVKVTVNDSITTSEQLQMEHIAPEHNEP